MCSVECQPFGLVWDFQNHFFLDTPVNGTTNTDKGIIMFASLFCCCVCVCEVDSTAFAYIYVNNVD